MQTKRRLRYQVAVSLDGFIAGPHGEYDWIVMDPAIDFAAMYKEFDTAVMGRKTMR
jgi:dihydrofolate reductase